MKPAVFLDRDGVIIENRGDYVKSPEEVRFLPGVLDALQRLSRSDNAIVVVTNQSVVGRGIITLEQALRINHGVVATIVAYGSRIDGAYLCHHRPDDGCACRKPAPGMLLQAARELRLDLRRSCIIGDAVSDVRAGLSIGARAVLVRSGRGAQQAGLLGQLPGGANDCRVTENLNDAVDYVLGELRNGR